MTNNYLYHHGILGMKWGIRRYQNEDGTLTPAGKKRYETRDSSGRLTSRSARNWYKDYRGKIFEKETKYVDEFDATDEGKKLKKEYEKQMKRLFETMDDEEKNPKLYKDFNQSEEAYLRKQGEYVAHKLVQEIGEEKASIYANNGRINTGRDAVKAMSDDWWVHAL